jgi:Leucine-rich repeat (LRR) protein
LPALKTLFASQASLADLGPLSALPALQELRVASNHVASLAPLAALKTLETLDVKDNTVSDLSPLSSAIGLERLYASKNSVSDLSPWRNQQCLHPSLVGASIEAGRSARSRPVLAHRVVSSSVSSFIGELAAEILLCRQRVVSLTPQGKVRDLVRGADCEGHDVMKLEPLPFRTAPAGSIDIGAAVPVAGGGCTPDSRRNVAPAPARL